MADLVELFAAALEAEATPGAAPATTSVARVYNDLVGFATEDDCQVRYWAPAEKRAATDGYVELAR